MRLERKLLVIGLCILLISVGLSAIATRTITDSSDSINSMIVCSNGNTYTATAANVQTALNSLTSGGEVKLPPGVYYVETNLLLDSNVSLIGSGKSTILRHGSGLGNNYILRCPVGTAKKNILIRDLCIDGNDSGHATSSIGIYLCNVTNFTVNNIYIHDTGLDGLQIKSSNNGSVDGIFGENTGNHLVFVGYTSKFVKVNNVNGHRIGTEIVCIEWMYGAGADETYWNSYITVNNCAGTNTSNWGYYIEHAKYITFNNCIISYPAKAGFYVQSARCVTLNNCQSKKSVFYGLELNTLTREIEVNNFIVDGIIGASTNHGLYIPAGANNITVNNIIIRGLDTATGANCMQLYGKDIAINNFICSDFNELRILGDNIILSNGFVNNASSATNMIYIGTVNGTITLDHIICRDATPPTYILQLNNPDALAKIFITDCNFNTSAGTSRTMYKTGETDAYLYIDGVTGIRLENAGNTSVANNGTIAHGLFGYTTGGVIPRVVLVTCQNYNITAIAYAMTTTTFKVSLVNRYNDDPVVGSYYVYWYAKA